MSILFSKVQHSFLLLVLITLSTQLYGQRYSRIQLELGAGTFVTSNERMGASIPFSVELKTQKGLLDFALRYQKSLVGIGVDHPSTSIFPQFKTLFATLSPYDPDNLNRMRHFESIQVLGGIHLNFEYFKPVIGVGFSLNRFQPFKQKIFRSNQAPDVLLVSPPNFYGWLVRLGHKVDRGRFYIEYHRNTVDGLRPILYLGTAVNIGLTPRQEKDIKFYKPIYNESRFENMICRIEIGTGYLASLHNEKYSGAIFLGAEVQVRVAKEHFVGFGSAFITRYSGYDRGTQQRLDNGDLFLTNAADEISFVSVYYMYNYQLNISKALFFGVGPGLYTVPTIVKSLPENLDRLILPFPFESTQKPGVNIMFGLRSSLLSNTIRFHIPFGEIPAIFEYKLGVGLNFHKA
jgi:hypothetical protein